MKIVIKHILLLLCAPLILASCKKDKEDTASPTPPTVNEEELITTLVLTFVDQENALNVFELRFTDLDGDGGNTPVITSDPLPPNTAYQVTLAVLNESVSPAEDITAEIAAEDEDHQFFFGVTGSELTMTYADVDANGAPVGLVNTAITGLPGGGSLRVTLRHQPDKAAAGVANGDITNAGGDTDIEIDFPVVIE